MTDENSDEDAGFCRQMFIGGVSPKTTEETLKQYFEKYGAVKDCVLMTNKRNGNSRGFGFVTYSNPSSVEDVMASCPHTLDNKIIDPKKRTPHKGHRIFVGGLSMHASEDDVSTYFTKYGVVTKVVLIADYNDSSRPHKGFGFVTFEDEISVDQAIAKHYHSIKDKRCEAKFADNRDQLQQQKGAQGRGGFNQGMGYDQNKMGGDLGNYQQQNSSAYGPMRSDYPSANNNGGSQPQSITGNDAAAVPQNRSGNNYSHGKAAAASTPASGAGYHPYRRM